MAPIEDRMRIPTIPAKFFLAIAVCILAAVSVGFSQNPPTTPTPPPTGIPSKEKEKIKEKPPKPPSKSELPPNVEMGMGTTSERSIAVDPRVTLTLCVTEGRVKINGWGRNEVRAFVQDGSRFGFHVGERSKDQTPALISLVSLKSLPGGTMMMNDCIAGEEIELDVPENAAVAVKGRETETHVDSIRKVVINNVGGDISVRNVSQGVRASTFQGDVTVESSQGGMTLESKSGNIVAYEVAPADVGDNFNAKTTSGAISLQKMDFRLADVNSISGSVLFSGELKNGGTFSFATTNGAIRLAMPVNTSCKVSATYGYGSFNSELPFKILTEDVHAGPVKTVTGMLGGGDCNLRLQSSNGAVAIKKL
jgi:hypothetical protein